MNIASATKESWAPFLQEYKEILNFSEQDEKNISLAAEYLLPYTAEIADELNQVILETSSLAHVFEEYPDLRNELEAKLERWIHSLLKGGYDDDFWSWHWINGLINARFDLDAVSVMVVFSRLTTIINQKIFRKFEGSSVFQISTAYSSLISCVSTLALKSHRLEQWDTLESTGVNKKILNRMTILNINKKLKGFSQDPKSLA